MKTSAIDKKQTVTGHQEKDFLSEFLQLRKRLLMLFILAALLVIATLTTLNIQFSRLTKAEADLSYVINISGRQRMLSQNIAKTSLLIFHGDMERLDPLDSIRRLFGRSHKELLLTNSLLRSARLDSQFNSISDSFQKLISVSGEIIAGGRHEGLKKELLINESLFLPQMDAIVKEYELIATKAFNSTNDNVKSLLYLIAVFVLLSGITVYFVAIRIIEKYSKELSRKTSELDQARLEVEKAKLKEQFAFVASHDLQEPIRTILSLTDLMADKQSEHMDDESKKVLGFIKESGERMTEQIKGLLDYSRLGRGQTLARVDLNNVLDEVEQDLRLQLEESDAVILKTELPEVVGYKLELRSVFQNLISNAVKFRKKSGAPEVHISFTQTDDAWVFSVRDNGIGMDSKHSDKIFKLFQRLNNRKEYTGVGIGLALCKHIVEMHHGNIWVDTETGMGSTFSFTLSKRLKADVT